MQQTIYEALRVTVRAEQGDPEQVKKESIEAYRHIMQQRMTASC